MLTSYIKTTVQASSTEAYFGFFNEYLCSERYKRFENIAGQRSVPVANK